MINRTTLFKDHPLQACPENPHIAPPVIGRNLFEFALAPEIERAAFLPKGLKLARREFENNSTLSISIHHQVVANFLMKTGIEPVVDVIREGNFEYTLPDGAVLKVDNEDEPSLTQVSITQDGECDFESFDKDEDHVKFDIIDWLQAKDEMHIGFIDAVRNACVKHRNSAAMAGVTLIDGVEVSGAFSPDPRLVDVLSQIDKRLESPKAKEMNLELRNLEMGRAVQKEAARLAVDAAQRAMMDDESARNHVLDDFFRM